MTTDRKHLVTTLVGVYSFYDKELTEYSIRVWVDALADFDVATVGEAFTRHLRDPDAGRFCPKPADVIRQIRGDRADLALIEWGRVLAAARAGGALFTGATQQAVDSIGGMLSLRMSDEKQISYLQRQFTAAFVAYRAREESPPLLLLQDEVAKATQRRIS
jgi:hypothetical protein